MAVFAVDDSERAHAPLRKVPRSEAAAVLFLQDLHERLKIGDVHIELHTNDPHTVACARRLGVPTTRPQDAFDDPARRIGVIKTGRLLLFTYQSVQAASRWGSRGQSYERVAESMIGLGWIRRQDNGRRSRRVRISAREHRQVWDLPLETCATALEANDL